MHLAFQNYLDCDNSFEHFMEELQLNYQLTTHKLIIM